MSRHDNVVSFEDAAWKRGLDFVLTEEGKVKSTALRNYELFLAHHPGICDLYWYDEFADQIMVDGPLPGRDGVGRYPRPVQDHDVTALAGWLNSRYLSGSIALANAAMQGRAFDNTRNPLVEWADSLVWDGKRRIDGWLSYYGGADDNDYTRLVGRRFLISAMARALRPGCKVDTMLVLEGPQGLKKSSMVEVLAGRGWFTDQIGDITSKDASQMVQGVWLVEVAEMVKFTKHESSAVKEFLTRTFDRYRPPYGRYVIQRDRRCVFFGTINPDGSGYLKDTTGNRRYWPVKVGAIDIDGIRADREQIWAEARNALMAGERWWIDADEVAIVQSEQEERREDDPWEPTVSAWLNAPEQMLTPSFTQADILWKCLGIKTGDQNHSHKLRIAKILTPLGYVGINNRNGIRGRSWSKKP